MATQEFPSFTSPIGKEGVLMLKNPSAWNFLSDWFGAAVLIVAGLAGLRVHPAFGVLALVGLLFAFVKAVLLNTTVYLVTDKRVIVKKGLISQHVSEVRISDIRGVNLRQGIWHRIIGIGDLVIGTAATAEAEIVIRGVGSPKSVVAAINSQRQI
jgi:uncharacterized membrane protein YdbT with pleckstrin-like domain